jgi:HEAT repeat protein
VIAATRDPDAAVRRVALWGVTFGALARPSDWPAFMREAAEDRAVDLLMRCDAIRALGEMRDTASADLLTRLLESEPGIPMPLPGDQLTQQEVAMIRYRQSRDVRAWAARSLGAIGARSALPLLLKSAEAPDDFFLRLLSVQTLVDWKAHEAVPVLIRRLEDPFPDIRTTALLALAKIGDPSVVDAVLPRLADQVVPVRVQAIETLVELGDARVRGKLEALQDKNIDPLVQQALDRAFARLPR